MNPPQWQGPNVTMVREELLARVEREDVPHAVGARRPGRSPGELVRLGLVAVVVGATVAAAWLGIVLTRTTEHPAPPAGGSHVATTAPTPSASDPVTASGPLDAAGALREYRRTIAAIPEPLPAGRAYPTRLPSTFFAEGGDGMLPAGSGRDQAWFTWLCAWEGDYLTAVSTGDSTRQQAAEDQLVRWPTTAFFRAVVDDPRHTWVTDVVDTMRAGDPSGVRADHTSRCRAYPTVAG